MSSFALSRFWPARPVTGNPKADAPLYDTDWGPIRFGRDGFENELRVAYGLKPGADGVMRPCQTVFAITTQTNPAERASRTAGRNRATTSPTGSPMKVSHLFESGRPILENSCCQR